MHEEQLGFLVFVYEVVKTLKPINGFLFWDITSSTVIQGAKLKRKIVIMKIGLNIQDRKNMYLRKVWFFGWTLPKHY